MDIAVSLVESYLRLNGYLTLSEFDIQSRAADGTFETVTDIDIMGIRFPGDVYAGDPHDGVDARLLLLSDDALALVEDQIDIIVGEVKQGEAQFNPGIRRHEVLHQILRRVEWLFEMGLRNVVDDLARRSVCVVPAKGGGTARVRLVAFGRAPENDLHTITHAHIVNTLVRFFSGEDHAFRPAQFSAAAPAMLNLLLKSGFELKGG
ncbi:MAG: hypothetical protein A2Z12_07390 [Actinobacteria bacterium RBG_16_68_21]|nr:MAG: hypothetical protein A2Z12_07390 [Actinobacteria bacterium RBG_16_68_21]